MIARIGGPALEAARELARRRAAELRPVDLHHLAIVVDAHGPELRAETMGRTELRRLAPSCSARTRADLASMAEHAPPAGHALLAVPPNVAEWLSLAGEGKA